MLLVFCVLIHGGSVLYTTSSMTEHLLKPYLVNNVKHAGVNLNVTIADSNYFEIEQLVDTVQNTCTFEYLSLHINIHSVKDKFDQLKSILLRLKDVNLRVDFILLCETFLTDQLEPLCKIDGFKLITNNRKILTKGGVAIYVTTRFGSKQIHIGEHIEGEFKSVFAEAVHNDKKVILGEIHRIPNTSEKQSLTRYSQTVEDMLRISAQAYILGTDQNFDYIKVDSHKNTSTLLNNFVSVGFIPTINKPTRITPTSSTLIDNIYVKSNSIENIILSDISDHLPVLTGFGQRRVKNKNPLCFTYRPLDDEKLAKIKNTISIMDWNYMENMSVNQAYESFIQTLNALIDHFAPAKRAVIPAKCVLQEPWITKVS